MFLIDMFNRKTAMPSQAELLPGRGEPIGTAAAHAVSGRPLKGPFDGDLETAWFAMGKFWGAEKLFWALPGVHVTAAGYAGGTTPNPTYQEVVTGLTGHAQTVMVVFDPSLIAYARLLETFFEQHDPTQGMRQGSDIGTFYRSAIYTATDYQVEKARAVMAMYQSALAEAGHTSKVTTEIAPIRDFYYAEAHHQQLLAKNPGAQSGLKPTGVLFPRD